MIGIGVREGEMLSPVLESRKAKAAHWEIEIVKQQPSGAEEQSKQAGPQGEGRKGARVCISESAEITKQWEEQRMFSI